MTFFMASDVEYARDLAVEYATERGVPVLLDNVNVESMRMLASVDSGSISVVRGDVLSPQARAVVAGLARSGSLVAYGRTLPTEFVGSTVKVAGLPGPLRAYRASRDKGLSDSEAARTTQIFSGDGGATEDHLSVLRLRSRVLRCVEAIRAHDLSALAAECERATSADVTVVLRSIVVEHETGRFTSWAEEEISPLLTHIDHVVRMLPKGFVRNPVAVFYAIMVGVFYAYAEQQ